MFCLVEVWEGVDHEANTKHKGQHTNDICTSTHKQISPIVLPLRVSHSLHSPTNYYLLYNTYTQGEYGKISLVLIESNWLQIRISNYVARKEVFFATK